MDNVETNEVKEVVPQTSEAAPVEQKTEVAPVADDRQDRNWRAVTQKNRELEKELRLQREMTEKILTAQMAVQPKQEPQSDELDELADSEYLHKGQIKKLVEKEKERIVKQAVDEIEKRYQQKEQSQFLDRLRRQYTDFDEIVNPDTISLLESTDPELAATIAESKDPYKIGVQSYKYIKALNLSSQAPSARRIKEAEKKIEANTKTVQTPQAYDKRPMAQAFQLTEGDKTELYREMMGYARLAGSVPELQ